jgi:hypothetical protein
MQTRAGALRSQDLAKLAAIGKPPQLPAQASAVPSPEKSTPIIQKPHPEHAKSKPGTHKKEKKDKEKSQNHHTVFSPYPHNAPATAPALPPGYHPTVHVAGSGRLDWTFVVNTSSLDPGPSALTAGYNSAAGSYELYVPPGYNPRQAYPLILQVNTAPRSDGWGHWQKTCQSRRVLFAGVHNAGNEVPMPLRARVVLDVLDDVRRRFHVDVDRTYITGCSGAGHAACSIGQALPELFGGIIPICGAWNLRVEHMSRQRVAERLSIAVLTGAMDFNGPELVREFYPILREQGVRSLLRVYPGMGHGYPTPAQLDQIFQWVEAGLSQRRLVAALFPASRLVGAASPDQWSLAVVEEAGRRLELPGGEASGLFELQAVVDRWAGLPAAELAQKLLNDFDAHSPVPWKQIARTERMNFRYLQAKMFDGIVNSPPPPNFPVPRINLLVIAIDLWQEIHDLAPADSAIAREASNRLTELHREAGR